MAVLNQMLRRRIAARARVHADRADTRAGVEIHHGKRQLAQPRRFDLSQMLDSAKNEAVYQGGLDAAVTGPGRDDDKFGTDLVASLSHTKQKKIVNRVTQRLDHIHIDTRLDGT